MAVIFSDLLNYVEKHLRLKSPLKLWNARDISPVDKNSTAKWASVSLSSLAVNSPELIYKKIQDVIFDFTWNGKPNKFKSIIISNTEKDLKFPKH